MTASVPLPFLNVVLWRVSRSCVSPLTAPGALIRSRFVFCSFVASANPFPCVSAVAGVAVLSTPLAITGQLARTRGVLGRRGWALESAAARARREAGARVRTNTFIRDMDLGMHDILDGRRLEVLADGLPLHGGAQLAIDTTMVSPLHRNGVALRRASSRPGVALKLARRRKELTYPKLAGDGGRARLVVLAAQVGGRWSAETAQFLSELASAKVRDFPEELQDEAARAWHKRWSSVLSCALIVFALCISLFFFFPFFISLS